MTFKKRVFIIHGWGASPDANWFPWMKDELNKRDLEVVAPQMPNADFPKQDEWLEFMHQTIDIPNENIFLIGHSLGVIAILRYLESLKLNQKIGGVILVSGFSESLGIIPEIENFFNETIDYEKIKLHCEKFIIINSDNDPYVPIEKGFILKNKLNGKFIVLNNAGHINEGSGNFKLPVALEELLNMTK